MSNVVPLVFQAAPGQPPPRLTPAGAIALPFAVATAAWTLPVHGNLRVWINDPGPGRSVQLTVSPTHDVALQAPVPIVLAGVTECAGEVIASGSDPDGRPTITGVGSDGSEAWRLVIDGPKPTRWPIPICAARSMVVWQTAPGRLELVEAGPGGLGQRRSIVVGGPPVDVAAIGGAVWCVWVEPSGIHGIAVNEDGEQAIHLRLPSPGSVAIGACAGAACVAWADAARASFARLLVSGRLAEPPRDLDLGEAAGGTLAVVPGPTPVVWAQRVITHNGEPPRWVSALVVPGSGPLMVEGPIHAATWWRDHLVLVGTETLHLLALEPNATRNSMSRGGG